MAQPWVEKYRPKSLQDVQDQPEVIAMLTATVAQESSLPHLLFHGSAGTGKTSTALALVRALFGPKLWQSRTLELNASDERGIDMIREKVKTFARTAVASNEKVPGYPCPALRIVILDEADSMTNDAQSALRRTMENFAKQSRFILICNYVSRIIEPVASRCAKYRFRPLSNEAALQRLEQICKEENMTLPSKETLLALLQVAEGDLRKAITFLQSAYLMTNQVTLDTVSKISGTLPATVMDAWWQHCLPSSDGKMPLFSEAVSFIQNNLLAEGYSALQFLLQVHETLLNRVDVSPAVKSLLSIKLAQVERRLVLGSDEFLQMVDVAAFLMQVLTAARQGKQMSAYHATQLVGYGA